MTNIVLKHTVTNIDFFLNHLSPYSLEITVIKLSLEHIKMDLVSGTSVLSISYGKYGRLVANGWIYNIWELIWRNLVKLCMRTPPVLQNQREEDIFLVNLITGTEISHKRR